MSLEKLYESKYLDSCKETEDLKEQIARYETVIPERDAWMREYEIKKEQLTAWKEYSGKLRETLERQSSPHIEQFCKQRAREALDIEPPKE